MGALPRSYRYPTLALAVLMLASYLVLNVSGPAYAPPPPVLVIFDANGGSGSMETQDGLENVSETLTASSLTRSGYLFSGWNTAEDGSGTAYDDQASYDFSESITLYAQWAWAPSYYPSGPQTTVSSSVVTSGGWELCWSGPYNGFAKFSDILAACDGEYIMYTGWNGVSTSPETIPATLPILATAPRSDVFTTTATSGIADATDSNGSKWYFGDDRGAGAVASPPRPQAVGFTDNQSGSPCYSGSLSICWHSAPNLPGSYGWADGSASPSWAATEAGLSPGWSLGATTHLGQSPAMGSGANYTRAIFHASNPVKSVTFNANSGSGSMSAQSGSSSSALTSNSLTRTGYAFSGWNSVADGSGTGYSDGASYDFSANLTLYAQWTKAAAPSVSSGGSSPASEPVVVPGFPANQGRVDQPVVPLRGALGVRDAPAPFDRKVRSGNALSSNKAVALVGGQDVAVSARSQGSQAVFFVAGKFSLDIAVAEKDGLVDSVSGAPQLKVARNSPASLKGAGLLPNSRLQVFLPASDGSFIEMPGVEVNADGSFEGSLILGTSSRNKPMPIGPRFIQLIGLDEDGNENVLDIPVDISQPSPTPEINRASGERPVLEPGQTVAFNAGIPETVTLTRSSVATTVEGDGWEFTVETDSPEATTETMALRRDAPVTFNGKGFMPGTRADIWLFSEPTLLGTVDIGANGTFEASFAVDSDLVPTGDHTLQIQGVGEDGFVRAANMGVVVADSVLDPVIPVAINPMDWLPLVLILTALGGLLVVLGLVLAIRRRRAVSRWPLPEM